MFETSLITLIGAIIAALGTMWQTYRGNQFNSELKAKIKLKSLLKTPPFVKTAVDKSVVRKT